MANHFESPSRCVFTRTLPHAAPLLGCACSLPQSLTLSRLSGSVAG